MREYKAITNWDYIPFYAAIFSCTGMHYLLMTHIQHLMKHWVKINEGLFTYALIITVIYVIMCILSWIVLFNTHPYYLKFKSWTARNR